MTPTTKPDALAELAAADECIAEIVATFKEPDWIRNAGMARSDVEYLLTRLAEARAREREFRGQVDTLFDAIKHGDEKYQEWLRDKIDEHFATKPKEQG